MAGNRSYNPPPYYRPPTGIATRTIPYISLVTRADPGWARRKYRDVEYYWSNGRVYWANPYQRGAYNTPSKLTVQSYTGPATFAAGDLTGVGEDFVRLTNNATTPGQITTRTGAQMFGDIPGAFVNLQWALRVSNLGVGDLTILAGGGHVGISGNAVVKAGTFSDFVAAIVDVNTVFFQTVSSSNPYQSMTH